MKKYWIILLALFGGFVIFISIENIFLNNRQDYMSFNTEPYDDSFYDELSYFDISEYYLYVKDHPSVFPDVEPITISASTPTTESGDVELLDSYEGKSNVLLTGESSSVTYTVNVTEAGFYQLRVSYYPYSGKSSSVERTLYINGEIPFDGASNITLYRIWSSESEVKQD